MNKLIFYLIIILSMASCSSAGPVSMTEADNGRTNLVNLGGGIEIVLKGNPTTGYTWETASFSTNQLRQVAGVKYSQSEKPDGKEMVGGGGKFIFRFKAVGSGSGEVKLVYRRSWETTAYDQVYSVVIDVK